MTAEREEVIQIRPIAALCLGRQLRIEVEEGEDEVLELVGVDLAMPPFGFIEQGGARHPLVQVMDDVDGHVCRRQRD